MEPAERSALVMAAMVHGLAADAAHSQLITVVVFHERWPTTSTMSFFPKRWDQTHWWNPRQERFGVWEGGRSPSRPAPAVGSDSASVG